jgi:hypothetical protein
MKKNILLLAFLFTLTLNANAQNLHVQCGLLLNLNCDDREMIINLHNPGCGGIIVSSAPITVWTGDDYTVNLAAIFGTLPPGYEIYSVEVRNTCSYPIGASGGSTCPWDNGATVGEPCVGLPNTDCFELTAACGPSGGIICPGSTIHNLTYTRNPLTGDVLLQIE